MKILITGGRGFLGKAVVNSLLNSPKYVKETPEVISLGMKDGDLIYDDVAFKLLAYHKPDVVIHLAAKVGGIGANAANPAKFFYENMAMGLNVIHNSHYLGVKKVVLVGTVCSYPSAGIRIPFLEDDLWNGYPEPTNAPYGIAKKALGVMLDAYHRQYGLQCAYLIPANLYGPGDKSDHVIPDMIRKFIKARNSNASEVVLFGDGTPTREFLYVADAADAVVKAAFTTTTAAPMNLGSWKEVSILDLAVCIRTFTNYTGEIKLDGNLPMNGQMKRAINCSEAQAILGWKAQTTLYDGLKKTVAYFEELNKNNPL